MRVLLIYPNLNCQVGFNYGLAHISAVLKEHGHAARLLNVNEKLGFPLDLDRIRRETAEFDPGLVGFSVVTNQYAAARRIAESIRCCCRAPIICGGIHSTMAPEAVLEDPCWDFACVGEGEGAMLELVERLERQEPTDDIANLALRRNARMVRNPVRPFVRLEDLPPKDYALFDFQQMIDAKDGWVGIMASRGCPFRCSYCFNHRMVDIYRRDTGLSGRRLNYIRRRPAAEVAAEIGFLLAHYRNITTFIFDDDILTMDKGYLRELCDLYHEVTDLPFVCNAHVRAFDEETAAILKTAGCCMVKFGLESGSPRVREKIMHRWVSNDEIARAFAAARAAGLGSSAFVMLGLPGETTEDLDQTIALLARIKPSRFRWSIFFPFVNTDAYDMSVAGGYIDFNKLERLTNFMEASCLDFGPEQNLRIRKLRRTLPWEVNVRAGLCAEAYRDRLNEIGAMNDEAFARIEDGLPAEDTAISQGPDASRGARYGIKYNDFMAVLEPEDACATAGPAPPRPSHSEHTRSGKSGRGTRGSPWR